MPLGIFDEDIGLVTELRLGRVLVNVLVAVMKLVVVIPADVDEPVEFGTAPVLERPVELERLDGELETIDELETG